MIDIHEIQFKHPFCMTVAGPSQCGKTHFVSELLKCYNNLFTPAPSKLIYCYSEWQDQFETIRVNVPIAVFHQGLPDYIGDIEDAVIVIDDLMSECIDDKDILHLFTRGSHHRNISVIFMIQNVFPQGKYARSISLNSHYLVLFNNPRDKSQIKYLSRQLYPNDSKFFNEVFEEAVTSQNYGSLIVDLKPNTSNALRLRSFDFVNNIIYVYIKK